MKMIDCLASYRLRSQYPRTFTHSLRPRINNALNLWGALMDSALAGAYSKMISATKKG